MRVLLTGMSGAGKSALIAELRQRIGKLDR
jgi:predicted ATPase